MAKAKTTAFSVRNAVMNHQNGWGSVRAADHWNTMVEEPLARLRAVQEPKGAAAWCVIRDQGPDHRSRLLSEINIEEQDRITTGFGELDPSISWGTALWTGSLVLVGRRPGISRSLLARYAGIWPGQDRRCFASGRDPRADSDEEQTGCSPVTCVFLCETSLDRIRHAVGQCPRLWS